MSGPFDLADDAAYQAWRAFKLSRAPAIPENLIVPVTRLAEPTERERTALQARILAYNMALVRATPDQIEPDAILAFGRALGLVRADTNLFADTRAITRVTQADGPKDTAPLVNRRGDYIPYTNRPLGWHTDGYYNPPERQVRSWTLFCVHPAAQGGVNSLLDHEIAYIRLRDASPRHLVALAHPEALTIPAHLDHGEIIRPDSVGPVFSVRDGRPHLRYSARTRNALWRATPETDAARAALDRLLSAPDVFTCSYRLQAGEGIVANNPLHNRSGFIDGEDGQPKRLLIRVRYLDAIASVT